MNCIYKYKGKDYTKDEFYSLVSNPSFIQQEQEKKFAELQERLNNKEFLEGAKNAFESSEELQEWGTQEQYNDFIARVSLGIVKNPSSGEYNYESQVKDIVYHGSKTNFEKFSKDFFGGNLGQISPDSKLGFFFSNLENAKGFGKNIFTVLLNMSNPKIVTEEEYKKLSGDTREFKTKVFSQLLSEAKQENKDSLLADFRVSDYMGSKQYIVFEPEQIHVLSSKADIEGFKEFVQGEKDDLNPFIDESNKVGEQIKDVENIQETNPNKQLGLFDNNTYYQLPKSREKEEYVASEKTIRDLAARMSDRIGIPVKFESDRTKEYKGKLEDGVAVINLAYADLSTPIHEILGHPIIRAIKQGVAVSGEYVETYTTTENGKEKGLIQGYYDKNSYSVKNLKTGEVKLFDNFDDAKTFQNDAMFFGKNTQLYQNLLKELEYGKGKEVLDRIKRDYVKKFNGEWYVSGYGEHFFNKDGTIDGFKPYDKEIGKYKIVVQGKVLEFNNRQEALNYVHYTLEEQQEEAIVELLGLMTAEKLDSVKDGKLISLLKRLLKEMKQFVRSLLNLKEVEIDKLPDNLTIGDLADLLAYSNSKLILPGYEVEYTTPDNIKFKTYQEASNHISELTKSVEDVDLSDIQLPIRKKVEKANDIPVDKFTDEFDNTIYNRKEGKWFIEDTNRTMLDDDIVTLWNSNLSDNYINKAGVEGFIEKNKEYEQSKEIIEEWKKVNNIQYNPEEIYSRGQEFSSVVGAYSNFDVNLMMQNLLSHIEDNEKAGGKFAISAYTKPIDKQIGHLEGGGGKIKFKLYPQSSDILWAANTDVYSGSVWDASEKVNKDKKSELLGVSYTKYPSLSNVNAVQPNLASIIDELSHHHNELAISLSFNNFEIEVDEDVPYQTKKIVENVNKVLQQKRLEEINNFINKLEKEC